MKYRYNVRTGVTKIKTKTAIALSGMALLMGGTGLSLALVGTSSAASYNPTDCSKGKMIVNVTYSVYNDADSGFAGDWAKDNLNRHMQIYDLGNGTFCETLNDTGSFVTTGPLSPQKGALLSAGIKGTINGGYVSNNFTGELNTSPTYAMKGNLGSFDATNPHPSFENYITSADWNQPMWGWTYHTAKNGNWINSSTVDPASAGDISD